MEGTENVQEGGIRLEQLKRTHAEVDDQNKERVLNRADSFEDDFTSILDQDESSDSENDNLERVIRKNWVNIFMLINIYLHEFLVEILYDNLL